MELKSVEERGKNLVKVITWTSNDTTETDGGTMLSDQ